ncbi:bacterio-opsin activator domain-containing protein [Halomarina litorea]|uniref:bacterio-opsin activator domain-containing protein n=1 Tax=Halomarina litorea TaxID=2961595 RepID=UPI0020C4530A|nr:bacterio-opsin activator domain-containing protein [Halomarina sp. BCD28]
MTGTDDHEVAAAVDHLGAPPQFAPLARSGLDLLPTELAIVDASGTIVYTNRAWRAFGEANDFDDADCIGVNYLAVCDASDDDRAAEAATGLRATLAGDRHDFSLGYPCHGPDEHRWFTMRAVPFAHEGERFALVVHLNVTDQKLAELRVRRRSEDFRTLAAVGDLVRDVVRSLLDVGSRTAVEELVCSRLGESSFYEGVWTVERDVSDGGLTVRTGPDLSVAERSGVESLTSTAVADSGVGAAIEAGGPAVRRDPSDPVLGALDTDAYLAVPIVNRGSTFGALVVHPPSASEYQRTRFDDWEAAALGALGETMGYATAAIRSQKLLAGDAVLELEFGVADESSFLAWVSGQADCTVSLDGFVPVTRGAAVAYLAVSGTEPERFVALAEESPAVDSVRHVTERGDVHLFECALERSPLVELATQGVNVRSATASDGGLRTVVEAEPNADVRALTNALAAAYPDSNLLARRDRDRAADTNRADPAEDAGLTHRQSEMVEAAYRAGYFSWPRESSGEAIAASFDISPPTFHQHLQVGLNKLLGSLYEASEE